MPQGSVLGSTLYVIYVNDLLTSFPANAVIAYADDITLTANGFTVEEASLNLQMLLNTVHSWSTENAFYLNILKCFAMHISPYLRSYVPANTNVPKFFQKIITCTVLIYSRRQLNTRPLQVLSFL